MRFIEGLQKKGLFSFILVFLFSGYKGTFSRIANYLTLDDFKWHHRIF